MDIVLFTKPLTEIRASNGFIFWSKFKGKGVKRYVYDELSAS